MTPAPSPPTPEEEALLRDELARLRAANHATFKRRIAVIGVVLLFATGVHWHREIGLWTAARWYALRAGGPTIDLESALKLIRDQRAIVIDVRQPEEFAVSHLDEARSLALSRLQSGGWPEDWPTDRPIIAYCTIGYRSGIAAKRLEAEGLDAHNLMGGILALADADQSLVNDSGLTWAVHTWRDSYAWLLPPTHRAVYEKESSSIQQTTSSKR
ncbi:MAG: rhodanese-like domain-containing protein [Phycisphaerae bacterium]